MSTTCILLYVLHFAGALTNYMNMILFYRHVGGLFTGNAKYPGLAALKESGDLLKMLDN